MEWWIWVVLAIVVFLAFRFLQERRITKGIRHASKQAGITAAITIGEDGLDSVVFSPSAPVKFEDFATLALGNLANTIYVVNGLDDLCLHTSMEFLNTLSDLWTYPKPEEFTIHARKQIAEDTYYSLIGGDREPGTSPVIGKLKVYLVRGHTMNYAVADFKPGTTNECLVASSGTLIQNILASMTYVDIQKLRLASNLLRELYKSEGVGTLSHQALAYSAISAAIIRYGNGDFPSSWPQYEQ